MLADKISYYEFEKKNLQVTPARYKNEFSWLKDIDSYALCNEQMNLQKAYNNFFRNPKTGFPKFKSKHKDSATYTTSNVNNIIKIIDSKHIRLPKIKSLRIKLHRRLPENAIIKSATLTRTSSNKFYISILIEYESQVLNKKLDVSKSIGLDYSSHDFYVDSFGDKANYPKYFRQAENKLAKEQRKLSKMKLRSSNYQKQKDKIADIQEHIANQRKDFLHKLSCKLTDNFDYIFVEDIDLQGLSQCLKLGKSTHDNGFGIF